MPILLKDNINAYDMVTTAGAVALLKNRTDDAFVSKQLKASGALILGKLISVNGLISFVETAQVVTVQWVDKRSTLMAAKH